MLKGRVDMSKYTQLQRDFALENMRRVDAEMDLQRSKDQCQKLRDAIQSYIDKQREALREEHKVKQAELEQRFPRRSQWFYLGTPVEVLKVRHPPLEPSCDVLRLEMAYSGSLYLSGSSEPPWEFGVYVVWGPGKQDRRWIPMEEIDLLVERMI